MGGCGYRPKWAVPLTLPGSGGGTRVVALQGSGRRRARDDSWDSRQVIPRVYRFRIEAGVEQQNLHVTGLPGANLDEEAASWKQV